MVTSVMDLAGQFSTSAVLTLIASLIMSLTQALLWVYYKDYDPQLELSYELR